DGKYLFVAPEQDGLPARIFNIEDPFDVFEVATYTANPLSLVHNPYILGDFAFISHNTEGLRIVDLVDPTTPVEVGYYDTWSGESGGFNGLWSACPYLPSGRIIGGNREDGLYIWEFEETYAGRLYGQVLDSMTNFPIPNAQIIFELNDTSAYSNALGEFRTGNIPGNFDITVSANGYHSKTFEFSFTEGESDNIVIKLLPETTPTISPEDQQKLKVFPNPFSDQVVINGFETKEGTIQILGPNGLMILELKTPLQSTEINASNWPAGIYLLKWANEKGEVNFTHKLVKE
ncbi:MAG: T9SS C-terminal target domain-containing protein, partial [Bacteroidetes bacterium]